MSLVRLVPTVDLAAVTHAFASLLRLAGAVLLPPLVVAIAYREPVPAATFAALALVSYGSGRLGTRLGNPRELSPRDAIVVSALAYAGFATLGAVPFLPHSRPIDALFESMSGFTTTGLTVLDPALLPSSLRFFRSYSQWVGGIGIVVLTVAVLGGGRRNAQQLFGARHGETRLRGNVVATTRVMLGIYLLLCGSCTLALLAAGLPPMEAALHALTTLSTGGFSPFTEGVTAYRDHSAALSILTLFMLLGAVSFPLYHRLRRERPSRVVRDPQLLALLCLAAAGALLFLLAGGGPLRSVFEAVSALTTTGYSIAEPSSWSPLRKLSAICLMIIGGSSGSTAGGIKLLRLLLLARLLHWAVLRASLPEEARIPLKLGGDVIDEGELRELLALIVAYPLLLALSTLGLTAGGFAVLDALFESASALGTVGLSTGLTGPGLALGPKLLLILDMWAGRLEILPLLILLYPRTWGVGRAVGRTG